MTVAIAINMENFADQKNPIAATMIGPDPAALRYIENDIRFVFVAGIDF